MSLTNHLRAVADAFPLMTLSATENLREKVHKSEVLLIARILLVVKAENIYKNTTKMNKTMETELSL